MNADQASAERALDENYNQKTIVYLCKISKISLSCQENYAKICQLKCGHSNFHTGAAFVPKEYECKNSCVFRTT